MPEGDTLHRSAARLRPALVGQELRSFVAPRLVGRVPVPPVRIESVEAVGKHLLIGFATGLVLETHLRMTGSWHLYRTGEAWQRPEWQRRVSVAVDGWVAVCFNAPIVRTWARGASSAHLMSGPAGGPTVDRLGPDLCVVNRVTRDRLAEVLDVVSARFAATVDADTEIADALLDQRIASGIGNVYKSEVLWACRLDPFTPAPAVDPMTVRELFDTASRLLQANLGDGPRRTMPGGGLAVYGRRGRPCPRCGTPVRSRPQGKHRRTTYWCPRCQAASAPA